MTLLVGMTNKDGILTTPLRSAQDDIVDVLDDFVDSSTLVGMTLFMVGMTFMVRITVRVYRKRNR